MIENRLFRVESPAASHLRVDRSEFIGEMIPVDGNVGIDKALHLAGKRFPDASHRPYAYRITVSGDIVEHFSDDGEPPGTAGRPLLGLLREHHLVNTILVVSRYFGGRKLGTRRLRRAFTESARMALDLANLVEVFFACTVVVSFPFEVTGAVDRIVRKFRGRVEEQRYDEGVRLEILFRREITSSAIRHLEEVIRDRGRIDPKEGETLVDA